MITMFRFNPVLESVKRQYNLEHMDSRLHAYGILIHYATIDGWYIKFYRDAIHMIEYQWPNTKQQYELSMALK